MSCYVAHTINMYSWSFCRGDKTYEEKKCKKRMVLHERSYSHTSATEPKDTEYSK